MGQSRAEVKDTLEGMEDCPTHHETMTTTLEHSEVLSLEDSHLLSMLCLSEM